MPRSLNALAMARSDVTLLAFSSSSTGRSTSGSRLGLVSVGDALGVELAEPHALRLLGGERVPGALGDQPQNKNDVEPLAPPGWGVPLPSPLRRTSRSARW